MSNTGPDWRTKDSVIIRDGFSCRRCGKTPGGQIHHRAPRGRGGTKAAWINGKANLVLLCIDCHQYVESHRIEAVETGWLIKRTSDDLPEEVPLIDVAGTMFTLTDDGDVILIKRAAS